MHNYYQHRHTHAQQTCAPPSPIPIPTCMQDAPAVCVGESNEGKVCCDGTGVGWRHRIMLHVRSGTTVGQVHNHAYTRIHQIHVSCDMWQRKLTFSTPIWLSLSQPYVT